MIKNTGFMAASTAVRLLSSMVLFIALARLYGPEEFGRFFYNFTLSTLFLLLLDYGFAPQMLREIGRDPADVGRIMGRVLYARLLLLLPMLGLSALYFVAWPQRLPDLPIFGLLFLSAILASFGEFFLVAFRGVGKFHEETKIATASSVLHFALLCGMASLGCSLLTLAAGFVVSRLVGMVWSWRALRRRVAPIALRGHTPSSGLATLRTSFAYAVDAGFGSFFQQVDTLIINHYLGPASVGVYQAGMRFLQGAMQFSPVLANVYLPAIAGQLNQREQLAKIAGKLNFQMLGLGVAGWCGFALLGGPVTAVLYGVKYQALTPLWPYIGLLMLLRYVAASQGVLLTATGSQSIRVWAQIVALAVLLGSAPALIAHFGLSGMLMSLSLTAMALLLLYTATLLLRNIPTGFSPGSGALAGCVLAAALFLLKT
ncbi:lipopolysaccharide biosynthesis protein [Rugamonas sp.]|uniref:lipopolysaccharide biosynthesis protein n=1 Tax=Rugamonas sp. TaxID=1926287 RepID=UPI0025FD5CE0|nr:lipopolysaccharide biosynthesis protein [Rugamonas sp.]